jgi:hypothetical protein
VLEHLVEIPDRQVNDGWVLLLQNLVIAVVLHPQVELLPFQLDVPDGLDLWNDELKEIICAEHLHLLIAISWVTHEAVPSAPE